MQAINHCSNYVYKHATPLLVAGAAFCTGLAITAYATPPTDARATYRAAYKAVQKTSVLNQMKRAFELFISFLAALALGLFRLGYEILNTLLLINVSETIMDALK